MAFDKTHQPCPDCNGSDCLSYNKDGSTWCFSCETYTRKDKQHNNDSLFVISVCLCLDISTFMALFIVFNILAKYQKVFSVCFDVSIWKLMDTFQSLYLYFI